MVKPQWVLHLEESYERIPVETFAPFQENALGLSGQDGMIWLQHLHARDFQNFFRVGNEWLNNCHLFEEKVFVLSWLIVGCEVNYDLPTREYFLDALRKLAHFDVGFYADCMMLYFDGVSSYFQSDLDTAEIKFNSAIKLFETNSDYRGIARCYLHLALIEQLRENFENAKLHLKNCLDICSRRNYYKTKNRALQLYLEIPASLSSTQANYTEGFHSNTKLEKFVELIASAITQKDVQLAHTFFKNAELMRRRQGYARGRFSLFQYLIQINFLKGPEYYKLAYLQLDAVKDQAILLQILDWMGKQNIPLRLIDEKRQSKNQLLLRKIEVLQNANSEVNRHSTNTSAQIIRLSQVAAKDVNRLVSFLYNKGTTCTKEEIFEYVYGILYDPVIHDSKLYKLILKAKKLVSQDLVINHYGEYSFNNKKYRLVK